MISALCRLLLGVFVAILTIANVASAGEIDTTYGGVCDFTYGGPVESGDLDKIKASGIKFGNGLCLDSPGGVFIEGVSIAEWLVETGVKTIVRPGAVCFSACAIVFMGGGYFEDTYLPQRELHFGGQLGFHAPYSVPSGKTYTAEQFAMAYHFGLESVAKMMMLGAVNSDDKGFIPTSVILELLKMPPDKLYMVDTGARIRKLGIEFKGAPPVKWVNRNVMNACFSAMGMDGSATLPNANPTRKVKRPGGGFDLWYEGYGAEATGSCVFRGMPDGTRKVAVPVWDDSDVTDSAFVTITDVDAMAN